VTSVTVARLDRVRMRRGDYVVGQVDDADLFEIRLAAARSFGIDGPTPGR